MTQSETEKRCTHTTKSGRCTKAAETYTYTKNPGETMTNTLCLLHLKRYNRTMYACGWKLEN